MSTLVSTVGVGALVLSSPRACEHGPPADQRGSSHPVSQASSRAIAHAPDRPTITKSAKRRAMVELGARDRARLVVGAYEAGLVRPVWTC